jgi:hypothetical protein
MTEAVNFMIALINAIPWYWPFAGNLTMGAAELDHLMGGGHIPITSVMTAVICL